MSDGVDRSLQLQAREEQFGRVRLVLVDDTPVGGPVDACQLTIDTLTLHDGRGGTIRAGGIGNVATLPSHRRRGLASQLLEHAIVHMRAQQLDASLLYGIDDFYDRFGWRSCGDERLVRISLGGEQPCAHVSRSARAQDLDVLTGIYAAAARLTPGAVQRARDGREWAQLDLEDVLVVERAGEVVAYAWRGAGRVPERDALARKHPDALIVAELHARDADAMLELVAAVRAHATGAWKNPGPPATALLTGAPETHPLRQLARAERLACHLIDEVRPTGGAMLLPFTERGDLPGELYQFLPDRF